MLTAPEPACLVIADISGYTGFLAGAELDHAQDVLADLTDTVVRALRPPLRLAELEGDAAFCYLLAESLDGSAVQDIIERCYIRFRRRLRDIGQSTSCECNACILIPALDLKFVVHHGSVVKQRVAGREGLYGSDVIVVHRLLKNSVREALGVGPYALYTEACTRAMGIADPAAAGLIAHRESVESIGEVMGWVRDLAAVWEAEQTRSRVFIEPKDALLTVTGEIPGPPAIVWEWMTAPARRPLWQRDVTAVESTLVDGRRGVGSTNHCMHGKNAVIEEILDWRPYDYVTDRSQMWIRGVPRFASTLALTPTATGTQVQFTFERPRSLKDRAVLTAMAPMLRKSVVDGMEALVGLVAADVAERRSSGTLPEPELPVSAGRHISQPITTASA